MWTTQLLLFAKEKFLYIWYHFIYALTTTKRLVTCLIIKVSQLSTNFSWLWACNYTNISDHSDFGHKAVRTRKYPNYAILSLAITHMYLKHVYSYLEYSVLISGINVVTYSYICLESRLTDHSGLTNVWVAEATCEWA